MEDERGAFEDEESPELSENPGILMEWDDPENLPQSMVDSGWFGGREKQQAIESERLSVAGDAVLFQRPGFVDSIDNEVSSRRKRKIILVPLAQPAPDAKKEEPAPAETAQVSKKKGGRLTEEEKKRRLYEKEYKARRRAEQRERMKSYREDQKYREKKLREVRKKMPKCFDLSQDVHGMAAYLYDERFVPCRNVHRPGYNRDVCDNLKLYSVARMRSPVYLMNENLGWCGHEYITQSRYVRDITEYGVRLKGNSISTPGKVELDGDKMRIRLTQKGVREMSEDERYVRCFFAQFDGDDDGADEDDGGGGGWTAYMFQQKFYAQYIYGNLGRAGDTPFDWAYLRSQLAFSIAEKSECVEASGDMPLRFVEYQFRKVAQQIFDTIPKDIKRQRLFSLNPSRKRVLKKMKESGLGDNPEITYFFMKIGETASVKMVGTDAAKKMGERMSTWISNGIDINRLVEMFEFVYRKNNNRFSALETVVRIADNIWGGDKKPWYFIKNFDPFKIYRKAKSDARGKYTSPMTDDDIQAVEEFSKYGGYNFAYCCEVYFQGGSELEKFFPRSRAMEIICSITKMYGIGNSKRAIRAIEIMVFGLGKLQGDEKEKFVKQYLTHIEAYKPWSEINGKMEGSEITVDLPGLDQFKAALEGTKDDNRGKRLDHATLTPGILESMNHKLEAIPLEERLGKALRPDHDRLAADHMLPQNTSAAIAALPFYKEGEITTPKTANVLAGAMNLYDRCREELGYVKDSIIMIYLGLFANAMIDPFNPPKRFFKLLSVIYETEDPRDLRRINRSMFNRGSRRDEEANPQSVRIFALRIFIDFYNRKVLTEKQFEDMVEYLIGENIGFDQAGIKYNEWDFICKELAEDDENITRMLESGDKHEIEEAERRLKNKDRVQWEIEHARMNYHNYIERAFSGTLNPRFDKFVLAIQSMIHYKNLIEALKADGLFDYQNLMGSLIAEMLSSEDPKMKPREMNDYSCGYEDGDDEPCDPDDDGLSDEQHARRKIEMGKPDPMLDPYKLNLWDEKNNWTHFMETLKRVIDDGLIDVESFKRELLSTESQKDRAMMLESFYRFIIGIRWFIYEAEDIDFEAMIDEDGELNEYAENVILKANAVLSAINVKYFDCGTFVSKRILKAKIDSWIKFDAYTRLEKVIDRRCPQAAHGEKTELKNAREALRNVLRFFGITSILDEIEGEGKDGERNRLANMVLTRVESEIEEGRMALPEGAGVEVEGIAKNLRRRIDLATRAAGAQVLTRGISGRVAGLVRAVEEARLGYKGVLPVGGKVHLLHEVDQRKFDHLYRLLKLTHTPFKLEAATNSFIIPPAMTAEEVVIIIKCLATVGLLDEQKPEFQVSIPGRLDNSYAAVLGSSILLTTEVGMEYSMDSFKTTTSETDKRIMAYDACGPLTQFPHMKDREGRFLSGRTDMLGRKAGSDIKYYQFIGTALSNVQNGGPFEEVGKWYIEEYKKLLEKNKIDGILNEKWVNNPSDNTWRQLPEKDREASRKKHYETVKTCTDLWFECAEHEEGSTRIVFEARELVDKLIEKMTKIQETLTGEEYYGNDLKVEPA